MNTSIQKPIVNRAVDSFPELNLSLTDCETPWRVRWHSFEGPLDLLLYLVRRQQVNIYDLPIALLTRQYLAYLDMMTLLRIDVAAEFLVMASTLILIKSRMLLPRPSLLEENPQDDSDPRQELVKQLLEYEALRRCVAWMEDHINTNMAIRRDVPLPPLHPPPVGPLRVIDIALTFANLIREKWGQMARPLHLSVLPIEDHFPAIMELTEQRGIFQDYLVNLPSPGHWVAAFLALLHLMNMGRLDVNQVYPFGPIQLLPVTGS